jgi:hypothetical protein
VNCRVIVACLLFTVVIPASPKEQKEPLKSSELLAWPRMNVSDFGCLLETKFGLKDPVFNCSQDFHSRDWGDPCRNTEAYYSGPEIPDTVGPSIHPKIKSLRLSWEHGRLQDLGIVFNGVVTSSEIEELFGLELGKKLPANIISADLQECGKGTSCLSLTGFDHVGAGDVDCEQSE